ncbi:hypothetical protein OSTOST_23020, partial [Ostertagia ostertagi]
GPFSSLACSLEPLAVKNEETEEEEVTSSSKKNRKNRTKRQEKPPYSYIALIAMAIQVEKAISGRSRTTCEFLLEEGAFRRRPRGYKARKRPVYGQFT